MAAGNIIRRTEAAPRIPIGLQPIGSVAQHEAIPWRIAKQMPDSGNKAEWAIAVELGTTAVELGTTVVELAITAVALGTTAVELGITVVELGITAAALGTTAVELETIVAELETEEATVQALGRATGVRIVEEAVGTASETEVFHREQTAVPGEVPLADRGVAPAAHVQAVREVRRA